MKAGDDQDGQERLAEFEAGIDTVVRPWFEHARIADETIDRLADVLKDHGGDDELDDEEWLEFLDAKAEYHARKANLGWLLDQSGVKPNPDATRVRDPRHGRRGRK